MSDFFFFKVKANINVKINIAKRKRKRKIISTYKQKKLSSQRQYNLIYYLRIYFRSQNIYRDCFRLCIEIARKCISLGL